MDAPEFQKMKNRCVLEGADPRDVRGIVGLNPAEVHDHTQVLNSLYNMLCE